MGAWELADEVRCRSDGWRVVQERDGNNTPTVSYTRGTDLSGSLEGAGGIGGLLARSHGYSGGTGHWSTHNFYHADGNGNITYVVNSSQGLAASYQYDPFGNTLASSGSLAGANGYRFSSKEQHVRSGLYYYGHRFYDPPTQRWPNQDPLGDGWRSPRGADLSFEFGPWEFFNGANLYHFVYNNPVTLIDAWGLDVFICSRDVKGTGGAGAHTWVEVIDSNGKKTTFSGIDDSGKLGVRKNYPADCKPTKKNPETSRCKIPPPPGMNQGQWDDAIKKSGENEMKKDRQRKYKLFGGDGGKQSGNCHCVSRQIIQGAGGQIPPNYDPPGANPGIR
jgi:RHS repeat-associated protein